MLFKYDLNALLDAFRCIALVQMLLAEFVPKATAVIGLLHYILKADGSNDIVRLVLEIHPIPKKLSLCNLIIISGQKGLMIG
jgi:hypothetical protein